MKKHCIYCGKILNDDSEVCPHCGLSNGEMPNEIDDNLRHKINQTCHVSMNKQSAKINNAFCFIIVGLILTIVGFVLLFLSFRYNVIKEKIFTPNSTEFVCCIICLIFGFSGLIYGVARFLISLVKRKKFKELIKS